ncbi:hypothetical protein AcV5_010405 [Taiwanofungus camphoratus]|nr:hypothetical protein AcV5_010405 [Antrodia cinnamomea]
MWAVHQHFVLQLLLSRPLGIATKVCNYQPMGLELQLRQLNLVLPILLMATRTALLPLRLDWVFVIGLKSVATK